MSGQQAHGGHRHGTARAIPILQALAAAPDGMTTNELAEKFAADIQLQHAAYTRCWEAMHKQERQGHVKRGEHVTSPHRNVPVTVWQITDTGRRFLGGHRDVPDTLTGTCVMVLCMIGHPVSNTGIWHWLTGNGEDVTRKQVKGAVYHGTRMNPPLIESAGQGLWQLAAHAHELLEEEDL
jgi:hypothetical protein